MFLQNSPERAAAHLLDDTSLDNEVGQLPQGPSTIALAQILRPPREELEDHADLFLAVLRRATRPLPGTQGVEGAPIEAADELARGTSAKLESRV